MSGAAINIIVAPWFERRRGLAVSWALNGASCRGRHYCTSTDVFHDPLWFWAGRGRVGGIDARHPDARRDPRPTSKPSR
jgi:hypothetical protein